MSLDVSQAQNLPILQRIALVDWFGFTVANCEDETLLELRDVLQSCFNIPADCWLKVEGGWYGYKNRISLGKFGLIAYGGSSQQNTVHVEINGTGCSQVKDWKAVRAWGVEKRIKITRLDLAHDDHTGEIITIMQALQWRIDGGFSTSGRIPKARYIDDFGSGEGKTLYIGKRKNGKLCRVYEKGKQLGDPNSPWVRAEVEWHSRDRVIPWDAVTNPSPFLAGAYPCFNYLSTEQSRIRTQKKAFEISYDRTVKWVRTAAGPSLHAMCEINGGDAGEVLALTMRPCDPQRLAAYKTPTAHGGERYPVMD